jgi:2-polyprenyl-3-methyl-5-hydroxy-6-metoxy-1,4-benzoquinol methylase
MDYKKYHRDKTYEENESHFKNIFRKRFKIAKYYSQKPGKVLDIGASTGVMLDIFHENGWDTYGVEPSRSAALAKAKNHKIYKKYFEKTKLQNNYFDLVIMNHTLEHVEDPLSVLKKIYKILRKEGIVLIDVPNAGGLASKILGNRWPYRLPREHRSQFTRKSLANLFREAGFKPIHSESRSGIFEFANPRAEIGEALIKGKKRFFTDIVNIPYDIFVTYLDMGDSITIVGRKI